jgi:hypothetical protein
MAAAAATLFALKWGHAGRCTQQFYHCLFVVTVVAEREREREREEREREKERERERERKKERKREQRCQMSFF